METGETTVQASATEEKRPVGRIVAGVLLILPALIFGLTELLFPTIRTLWLSVQRLHFPAERGEFVGLQNYAYLLENVGLGQLLGFTALSLVVRLAVVAFVPLLLAWAVSRFGRRVRLGLRILLLLPVALFVPVAIGTAWSLALHPIEGIFSLDAYPFLETDTAGVVLLAIDAVHTFGLACGLGLIFYLPIWRRPDGVAPPTFREALKPLLVTWGVGILAAIGLTLSAFTLNFTMTAGGPWRSTMIPGLWIHNFAFTSARIGLAASVASIILLLTLPLGLIAGLLILLTRVRLAMVGALPSPEEEDDQPAPQRRQTVSLVLLVLGLLLVLGAWAVGLVPFGWLAPQAAGAVGLDQLWTPLSPGRVLLNTFLPPLITAVVQLLVAYLAALGIGALQPLGKRSEWLLLPFSPWLFVTILPLSIAAALAGLRAGTLDTFMALISPVLFSVPSLFILTLFFKGQAPRWKAASASGETSAAGAFLNHLIFPSLPLAGALFLFSLFAGWQRVFWPLVSTFRPENRTLAFVLYSQQYAFSSSMDTTAATITRYFLPTMALFFLAFVPFQFFLDRLVLTTGGRERQTGSGSPVEPADESA